jgi:hypothetical protein
MTFVPWPLPKPRKHNPHDLSTWGTECARGFVSDSRFSSTDRVIPRTNRDVSRKWRTLETPKLR